MINPYESCSYLSIAYRNRQSYFRRKVNVALPVLEVGPGHIPTFSKRAGTPVEYVDVLSAPEMVAKYTELGIDCSAIEDIDHVWSGERLTDLVPLRGHFGSIFASHVVEHIPDLIAFFQQCETLLRADGDLVLAVPDARRSFDFFRPISTTGQFLESHLKHATRHPLAAVFDFHANFASYGGRHTWFKEDHVDMKMECVNTVQTAYAGMQAASASTGYADVHGWVFTPSSFLLLLQDARALGLVGLQVMDFAEGDAHEFYAVLKKASTTLPGTEEWNSLSRDVLLVRIAQEVAQRFVKPVASSASLLTPTEN